MAGSIGYEFVILLCKFSEDTFAFKLWRSCVFDELVRQLASNWHFSDVGRVSLCYSIPGHSKCFLRDDTELQTMFCLVDTLSLKLVNVAVCYVDSLTLPVGVDVGSAVVSVVSASCGNRGHLFPGNETGDLPVLFGDGISNGSQGPTSRSLLSSNWSSALSHVGQVFGGGVCEFRRALCRYSVELGFKFVYLKNNKVKVKAVCSEKWEHGCNWLVCASFLFANGSFILKKFVSEHSCGLAFVDSGAKRLSYTHVAELIVDQIRVNPGIKPKDVVSLFRSNYGFELPSRKALRSLDKAKGMIYGDARQSFNLLGWYSAVATEKNPGSHIVLDVNSDTRRFRRIFVSFHASIVGFQYCRPLLFVDGTFLKGSFKGVILSATAKDGNQGLYPLAYAVVDSETLDNWRWFLSELKQIVDSCRVITFISDRNQGLLEALPQIFGGHNHFFCLQHLKANLRDRFRGTSVTNSFREHVVWLFRECAHAPSESDFVAKLSSLKECGGVIVERFLEGLPFRCWTNAFGEGCRYGEMTSNAAESFNAWLLDVRDLPITHMIDSIRIKLMNWFSDRRSNSSVWSGFLCPKLAEKFNSFVVSGRTWTVKRCSDSIFEVFSDPSVTVDTVRKTCSCCMWELGGFPCAHASVVINRFSFSLCDMVECFFSVESYCRAYEEVIYPVPTILLSNFVCNEDSEILAPSTRRQPGRPRKRRFRSAGEVVRRVRCGRCGKLGSHNRKTCKEPLQ